LTESSEHRKPVTFHDRNLLMLVFYEGPWEKLMNFCWGIRKGDGDTEEWRWVIGLRPKGWKWVLYKIANWAERRDMLWRAKYIVRRKNPPDRWKRQVR
jgi:hypothetical protein